MTEVPPPPPLGVPYGGAGAPPNNNLVLAIVTTVLCCVPLGIFAIIKAAEVNGKWSRGDYAGAQASAATAKKVSLWGIGVGAVGTILYIILLASGVLTANAS